MLIVFYSIAKLRNILVDRWYCIFINGFDVNMEQAAFNLYSLNIVKIVTYVTKLEINYYFVVFVNLGN